jgi:hypothetical protein
MNRTELMNSLAAARRKGVPEPIIEDMRRDGLDEIAKRKSLNATRIKVEGLWREKILPLQEEKKRVVASLAYTTHNRNNADPRQMALKAYLKVLDELLGRMRREAKVLPDGYGKRTTMTPSEYIKSKNVPNNGEHWSDFVPQHIKDRVCQLFDAVPHTPKARRKIPFERIVGVELHTLLKDRLIRRTEKELVKCKQDVLLNPREAEPLQERVRHIEQALDKIANLEPNEPVPTTWHGLI